MISIVEKVTDDKLSIRYMFEMFISPFAMLSLASSAVFN